MSGQPGRMERAGWIGRIFGIASRDLLESLRDRRTLFITLFLPMLMYPIVAVSSTVGVRTAIREREDAPARTRLSIVVSGEESDEFVSRIERLQEAGDPATWPSKLRVEATSPKRAKALLEAGRADLWIDLPAGLVPTLDETGMARFVATLPSSRPTSPVIREQCGVVLGAVVREARLSRLENAGLQAAVLDPPEISFIDLFGKPTVPVQQLGNPTLVGAILMLLAVLTLTGGYYPAVDAIAGEKERGTIETLLIAPCSPWEFAFGKFVSVFVVTMLTLFSNILSIGMTAAVTQRLLPSHLSLVPRQSAVGFAIALASFTALAAIGTALCLAVTAWSRSTKEAQHSLTPVIIVVSLLSGLAIGPSATASSVLSAVPFSGQVVVAKEAVLVGQAESPLRAAAALLGPLVVTLVSAGFVVAMLVRATASFLVDEEVLFRGPDAADGILSRPAFRPLPTVPQAIAPAAAAVAGLWYLQAIVPDDLLVAIPVQQAVSLVIPLLALAWWQRVDLRRTLRLALPARGRSLWTTVAGAALVGIGLFVVGAAAVLVLVGEDASAEMRALAARLIKLVMERPVWLSWILIAVLPAVCEEVVFRGWVLSGLAGERPDRIRRVAAVAAQAAFFAAVHLLPERMPTTFVLGLVVGWMAMATGSLLPGIVCHAAHNSVPIAVVLAAGSTASPDSDAASWPLWVPAVGAAVAIVGGFIVWREARSAAR